MAAAVNNLNMGKIDKIKTINGKVTLKKGQCYKIQYLHHIHYIDDGTRSRINDAVGYKGVFQKIDVNEYGEICAFFERVKVTENNRGYERSYDNSGPLKIRLKTPGTNDLIIIPIDCSEIDIPINYNSNQPIVTSPTPSRLYTTPSSPSTHQNMAAAPTIPPRNENMAAAPPEPPPQGGKKKSKKSKRKNKKSRKNKQKLYR